jgi:Cu+-exporting ATPase
VRHPIYAGGLSMFVGGALLKPTSPVVLACALGFIWLIVQARLEEIDLVQRVRGYRDYMKEVPRFLPFFRVKVTEVTRDSVCGMNVGLKTTVEIAVHKGKTYSFCSSRCKARFALEPEKYVQERDRAGNWKGRGHLGRQKITLSQR